jgi:hypothetical protein
MSIKIEAYHVWVQLTGDIELVSDVGTRSPHLAIVIEIVDRLTVRHDHVNQIQLADDVGHQKIAVRTSSVVVNEGPVVECEWNAIIITSLTLSAP